MINYRERLNKLWALAADQAGTPEGELAARMARQLIRERAREMAGLPAGDPRASEPFLRHPFSLEGGEGWRRRLAHAVARHCACRLSWSWRRRESAFYGPACGVEIAEFLYLVVSRAVAERSPKGPSDRPGPAYSFCHSAVLAMEDRLAAIRSQERREDPEGNALVLARGQGLDRWIAEQGLRRGPLPFSGHRFSPEGYDLGQQIPLQEAVRGGEGEPLPGGDISQRAS